MKTYNLSGLIIFLLTLSLIQLQSEIVSAQNKSNNVLFPSMGRVTLTLDGGGTMGFTDYASANIDLIWRGGLEYFFNTNSRHIAGLSVFGGTGSINGNDPDKIPIDFKTSLAFYGGGITYGYLAGEKVLPTLFAGISNLNFDPKYINGNKLPNNENGMYKSSAVNLNLELGLRYLVTEDIGIKIVIGTSYNFNDNLDDITRGSKDDIFYMSYLGLFYTINSRKDNDKDGVENNRDLCPDTPIGISVDENGCPVDEDRDGVPDYLDKCPNTSPRIRVDKDGCPADTDNDGVTDNLDKCPDTPPGAAVDNFGCPLDSDYDGVPDYADECPDTPGGIEVNEKGCPVDSDGDGVSDYDDRCPDTPKDAIVDNTGCALDTDSDGVPDYLDKCPDTPYGTRVYPDGCSSNFQEYIFSAASLFNPGESVLLQSSYTELNKVIARIRNLPKAKWRIEGHTDNTGKAEDNLVLSFQRAQAVYDYFISKKLSKDKFEVVGLGGDSPLSDNETERGRGINQRVVLIRTR